MPSLFWCFPTMSILGWSDWLFALDAQHFRKCCLVWILLQPHWWDLIHSYVVGVGRGDYICLETCQLLKEPWIVGHVCHGLIRKNLIFRYSWKKIVIIIVVWLFSLLHLNGCTNIFKLLLELMMTFQMHIFVRLLKSLEYCEVVVYL